MTVDVRMRPDELLTALAAVDPTAPALVDDDSRVDRGGLQQRAEVAQSWLASLGLQRGVVGLQLGNRIGTLAIYLAAWRSGLTPVNLNRRYRTDEVAKLVGAHGLAGLVTTPDRVDGIAAAVSGKACALASFGDGFDVVRPRRAADTPRPGPEYALLTGGTTGAPKLVAWTFEDIVLSALYPRSHPTVDPDPAVLLERSSSAPEGATLIAAPVDHAFGQWVVLAVLLAGGVAVLTDRRPLDPHHLLARVEQEGCRGLNIAGQAFLHRIVDALGQGAPRPPSLRRIVTGGAPTRDDTKRDLWRHLPDVALVEGVGASESGTLGRVVQVPATAESLAPRFVPTAGTVVVDDELTSVRPGETGRLARRGRVALGYVGDPDPGRFRQFDDGSRFALLGDAATLHHDGTFTLRGRLDRVINTGGQKVDPREVEDVLSAHPSVVECMVFGIPDEQFGERVGAVVCHRDEEPTAEDLRAHVRSALADYKAPSRVVQVRDDLPRLDSGKLDLSAARRLLVTTAAATATGREATR